MPELTYFVSFKLYNSENKGWAYKYELKTTNYDEAVRKFGELIKTYYKLAPFSMGCIMIEDMFGNRLDYKNWMPTETVEEVIE